MAFHKSIVMQRAQSMQKWILPQLDHNQLVTNAEIYQALHVADDALRFQKMFPDSSIAKSYQQGRTKIKYVLQFGIAPYIKDLVMLDVQGKPFAF